MSSNLLKSLLASAAFMVALPSMSLANSSNGPTPPERFDIVDIRSKSYVGSKKSKDLIAIISDSRGRKYQIEPGTELGSDGAEVSEIYPDKVVLFKMVIDELDGRERPKFTDVPFAEGATRLREGKKRNGKTQKFTELGDMKVRLTEIRSSAGLPIATLETSTGQQLKVSADSGIRIPNVKVIGITPTTLRLKERKRSLDGSVVTRNVTMKLTKSKKPGAKRASYRWNSGIALRK